MLAAAIQLVSCRADAQRLALVVEEVAKAEGLRFGLRHSLLRPLARSFFSLAFLVPTSSSKRRIASAVVAICDVHVRPRAFDRGYHRTTMKPAIRGHLRPLEH